MDEAEQFVRDAMSYARLITRSEPERHPVRSALSSLWQTLRHRNRNDGDTWVGVRAPAPKHPPARSAAVELPLP